MEPDDVWQDDDSWWHQQDQELQEREEQERIEGCNRALDDLKESGNDESL